VGHFDNDPSHNGVLNRPLRQPLKVLFLSSDTGGGHRASAESLAKQFQLQFPGSTYDLLDVMKEDGIYPYNTLVDAYKHLSAHPKQWQIVYGISNTRAYEMLADAHLKIMCERAMRRRIKSYSPDVVVSVHPLMTNVPVKSCRKISDETGKYLPVFTVVTDLGSAHCLWFANGVDRMFIASDQIRKLAKSRGKVPDDKLIQAGLPIRHDFSVQAEKLGDRMSMDGKEYQIYIRRTLNLEPETKTILVMGGGEGVGSLSAIVNALYFEFYQKGVDVQVVVVCGRNLVLKDELEHRNWDSIVNKHKAGQDTLQCFFQLGPALPSNGCLDNTMASQLKRIISQSPANFTPVDIPAPTAGVASSSDEEEEEDSSNERSVAESTRPRPAILPGNVSIIGLGFINNMAEYMVAADILISKAGPGTIAEAASVGLPVMLTSYLPGQEEGNVDFVIENEFGAFISDSDPFGIAEEVCRWATNEKDLQRMSVASNKVGCPNAAAEIVQAIGERTLHWRSLNEQSSPETSSKSVD
jgi:UDP-N-acetylglucosamine:LPS N-acetylglucosamine transferase